MLCTEIIAFFPQIHTKQINTLFGQNVGFCLISYWAVYDLITGIKAANVFYIYRNARLRIHSHSHTHKKHIANGVLRWISTDRF
jgi:hypothetical protein